ncbi:MAG TPA: hypothetical protein VKP60_16510 [Magnetospirillaceae bacterium]|nr:hypothetical protein [Magnetospirillaceae bacterium]
MIAGILSRRLIANLLAIYKNSFGLWRKQARSHLALSVPLGS